MDKFDEEVEEIIEHKITKVNGEIGFKKYSKGKMLGKGKLMSNWQVGSPSVTRA